MSIDPTYESENMLIGQSIEKVVWETFYDHNLSSIRIYSSDSIENSNFSNYSVKIYAVPEVNNENDLLDYSDILGENNTVTDSLNTFVKTTILGKALVIVAPILVIIFLLTILVSLVKSLATKRKRISNTPIA
jgi:hypothetical protein